MGKPVFLDQMGVFDIVLLETKKEESVVEISEDFLPVLEVLGFRRNQLFDHQWA